MAYQRYYLPFDLSGTPLPASYPAYGSEWDTVDAAQRVPLQTGKSGVDNSVPRSVSSMGPGQRGLLAQASTNSVVIMSGQLQGRVRAAYAGYQAAADGDCYLTMTVKVFSADGSTERAVLIDNATSASEFDTSAAVRTIPVTEFGPVAVEANDLFVVEIGISRSPSGSSAAATLDLTSKYLGTTDLPYADGPVSGPTIGWIEVELDAPPQSVEFTGAGSFTAVRKPPMPKMFATLESSVIPQAPGALTVYVTGANPNAQVSVEIEGVVVANAQADSDGFAQVSVPVTSALGGGVGSHDLSVQQSYGSTTETVLLSYSVASPPALLPSPPGPDAAPVETPESVTPKVRRWVFQDLVPGGLGNYVLPINPREMTSPHYEHSFTSRHTSSHQGRFHIFQAAMMPKEWTFGGYCPTQDMAEKLWAFRMLNRRIYIVDHHARAWKVAITHLEITPRLQHVYNGQISDWGSDWQMTVTVLDQEFTVVP